VFRDSRPYPHLARKDVNTPNDYHILGSAKYPVDSGWFLPQAQPSPIGKSDLRFLYLSRSRASVLSEVRTSSPFSPSPSILFQGQLSPPENGRSRCAARFFHDIQRRLPAVHLSQSIAVEGIDVEGVLKPLSCALAPWLCPKTSDSQRELLQINSCLFYHLFNSQDIGRHAVDGCRLEIRLYSIYFVVLPVSEGTTMAPMRSAA